MQYEVLKHSILLEEMFQHCMEQYFPKYESSLHFFSSTTHFLTVLIQILKTA